MNFFAHQDQARRKTYRLVALFALAVLGIVAGINLVLLLVLGAQHGAETGSLAAVAGENLELFVLVTVLVLGVIAGATATRMAKLRQGGDKVAEMLGGTRVSPATRDPLERRLLNVVEEMALASGTPVPSVYVLGDEAGINAFAAGYNAGEAAVAVTRGALETLTRAELQGVIAHEVSHIVNGDMRLNTRLMGVLFGILVLTVLGRMLLYGARFRGGGRRGGGGAAAILAAALALVVLGYIGVFFGRLIKAGVSRQRESLADASAVQFTREPGGLAGALKKIGALQGGSAIQSPEAEEVSHMLFGQGFESMTGLLATHPPILQRIQAIEPHFDEQEYTRFIEQWERQRAVAAEREAAREEMAKGRGALEIPGLGELAGGGVLTPAAMTAIALSDLAAADRAAAAPAAARLLAGLPAQLYEAVHTEGEAAPAVVYLLLSPEADIRQRQIDAVARALGPGAVEQLRAWLDAQVRVAPEQRLPLLELAIPTLRQRSKEQLGQLESLIRALSRADGRITVFEYALATLFRSLLRDVLEPGRGGAGGRRTPEACRTSIQTVLSVVARAGTDDETSAAAAYLAGIARLPLRSPPGYAFPESWVEALDAALEDLRHLRLRHLETLVAALGETLAHNGRVTLEEFELLRALCGALHCPVPPLLPASPPAAPRTGA